MALGRHKTIQKIQDKLLKIGWQSWSTKKDHWFKFPSYNFHPHHQISCDHLHLKLTKKSKAPAYGWCSWYPHGTDINEDKILTQAKWIAHNPHQSNLPLEYILVDDGWNLWGDWQSSDVVKFPHGLPFIVKKIKGLRLKSGVWMAPFLVDPRSDLARHHPDWLVQKNGQFVEGLNFSRWDRFFSHKKWLLDIKTPAVRKYLDSSLKYLVEDCGFDLLKLDFLYALHFNPFLKDGEADLFLRRYLSKIKKKYPEVYTIACGCPLIPAAGVVDSMRIGPDTKVISPFLKFIDNSLFNRWYLNSQVLPAIVKKLWTRKIWHVDPDAFLCRKSLGYNHDQLIKFQKLIKRGAGNIFLGDDLTKLSSDRIRKYLLPLFNKE